MDPEYFPTARMREIIDYLHNHNQHYSKHCTYSPGHLCLRDTFSPHNRPRNWILTGSRLRDL
jgi:hypothetical protein